MPIEALIDPDTGGVIVAKPAGSIWGRCEVNAVVLLEDAALEAELAQREHVVYPYAAYEERTVVIAGRERAQRQMLEPSLVTVQVSDAATMKRPSARSGVLRAADADVQVALAQIDSIKPTPQPQSGGNVIVPSRSLPAQEAK